MDELLLQKDMTESQRAMFQSEMARVRKDPTVALLLCLFFGGIGAHYYYMGEITKGILCTLFVWTLIPSLIAFINLFTITGTVRRYNQAKAQEIALMVKSVVPAQSVAATKE